MQKRAVTKLNHDLDKKLQRENCVKTALYRAKLLEVLEEARLARNLDAFERYYKKRAESEADLSKGVARKKEERTRLGHASETVRPACSMPWMNEKKNENREVQTPPSTAEAIRPAQMTRNGDRNPEERISSGPELRPARASKPGKASQLHESDSGVVDRVLRPRKVTSQELSCYRCRLIWANGELPVWQRRFDQGPGVTTGNLRGRRVISDGRLAADKRPRMR
ncbi:hypothetical protein IWX90DRAFT_414512 [Phyllosticta citrichinensis]|uniref:Uncharacterized protein n=1 Tax=Phyllosticta citrichinensis TaxID=1130410 RepID=A0ABR1XXK8_9PEZI